MDPRPWPVIWHSRANPKIRSRSRPRSRGRRACWVQRSSSLCRRLRLVATALRTRHKPLKDKERQNRPGKRIWTCSMVARLCSKSVRVISSECCRVSTPRSLPASPVRGSYRPRLWSASNFRQSPTSEAFDAASRRSSRAAAGDRSRHSVGRRQANSARCSWIHWAKSYTLALFDPR